MHKGKGFWDYVNKTATCWLWKGGMTRGYGVYAVWRGNRYRNTRAHRVAYELTIGFIPVGLEIDHLCRVRNCVNPAHLEAVTHRENILRGIGPEMLRQRHLAKKQRKAAETA